MKHSDKILSELKNMGFKSTKVRDGLVEILASSQSPLDTVQILESLKKLDLKPNKTTVYRELAFLKEQNFLQEIEFGEGKKRYEISEKHHHHIVCINCQKVSDLPLDKHLNDEENKIIKKLGYKPIGHSLEFFGLCEECQKEVNNSNSSLN